MGISDDEALIYNVEREIILTNTFLSLSKIKVFSEMDCSICIQPCIRNQAAVGNLIQTHCNHIFHSNCLDNWNHSGQASAAACPNCRTELIAFFIDETDGQIIEANMFILSESQINT